MALRGGSQQHDLTCPHHGAVQHRTRENRLKKEEKQKAIEATHEEHGQRRKRLRELEEVDENEDEELAGESSSDTGA